MNRKNMLMIALTVYLSCAEMATPPKTESHTIAIPRHAAAGERRQVWVRVPHESEEERLRLRNTGSGDEDVKRREPIQRYRRYLRLIDPASRI